MRRVWRQGLILGCLLAAQVVGAETIILSTKGSQGEYWQLLAAGVNARAAALGWTVIDASPPSASWDDRQATQLAAALAHAQPPVSIVIAPINAEMLTGIITQAYTDGVKIVVLEGDLSAPYHARRIYPMSSLLAAKNAAVAAHGKPGKPGQVQINANQQALAELKNGQLHAIIQRDPWQMGYDAVGLLDDLRQARPVVKDAELTPITLTAQDVKGKGQGWRLFDRQRLTP